MPRKSEPLDALRAIATDLLSQSEAQHRAATRLDLALRQMQVDDRMLRARASVTSPIEMVRTHMQTLRELFATEGALLDELEREIAGVTSER